MDYIVRTLSAAAQPIATVGKRSSRATLIPDIRELFDRFYTTRKGGPDLNIALYGTFDENDTFDLDCGVVTTTEPNGATPAGTIATTTHIGPYSGLNEAHRALHAWVREQGHRIAGPSWEIYGHWTDDPSQLRTDIFYLLRDEPRENNAS